MADITARLDRMFAAHEAYNVSGSVAELGPRAGELTWANALEIAANHADWLTSPLAEAVAGMREWAIEAGMGDGREDIATWPDLDCLGLFVQNVAHELRMIGSDDYELSECIAKYEQTDWEAECEYPTGSYYLESSVPMVSYYTGV